MTIQNVEKKLSSRVADLVKKADELLNNIIKASAKRLTDSVDYEHFSDFRNSSLSFINSTYGTNHIYYSSFDSQVSQSHPSDVAAGRGILNAIKYEIENGWLTSIRNLVSSELFVDFLEMAEHLLNQNYKDPSAVMIGSVLEEHLRQLCSKFSVDVKKSDGTPKKADAMNADLAKASAYNALVQKMVTGWLGLRNNAAHGKYTEYTQADVKNMLGGVITFISQNPL